MAINLRPRRKLDDDDKRAIDLAECRGWTEFCAWLVLVMTPIICWLQGPSVSTDQFVVRISLLIISASAAMAFRSWAMIERRRSDKRPINAETSSCSTKTTTNEPT